MTRPAHVVAMAGLLHDIGKFRQRAFWEERRNHQTLGRSWLEQSVLPRLSFLTDQQKRQVAEVVEQHHHSGVYARDIRVVQLADRLASGERVRRAEEEETGDPSTELLLPVFAELRLQERGLGEPDRRAWAYATVPLELGPGIFPQRREGLRADYPKLWNGFQEAWEALPDTAPTFEDPDAFVLTWLSLLRTYVWCVPAAAYRDEPDVSLADHLQVTGALAACLWDVPEDVLARLEGATLQEQPVALLVGGDVTGIQRFLYTISSSGAAKSLRGRSAYLSLLCEAVAEHVRRQLDLLPCNVLYSSGGHFYLLAPLGVEERLNAIRENLTDVLLDFFGGDVAIVVEAVQLRASDLKIQPDRPVSPLGKRWRELSGRLREAKQTLLREVALKGPGEVFGPFGVGGRETFCVVCHSEPDQPKRLKEARQLSRRVDVQVAAEAERKCSLCNSFEELSGRIARAEYLVIRRVDPKTHGSLEWHSVLKALGIELWINDAAQTVQHYRPGDWVVRLNDPHLKPLEGEGRQVPVVGFRYLPNFTPFDEIGGAIREIGEMAEGSEGAPYFGALRMDVDSLGRVFSEGLGGRLSISRVATLSRSLSMFFEGYVNEICGRLDPERKHLYLLYSGGDDLLAVGSWDKVVTLGMEIRREFRRYVCENPALTLSGGTSLHDGKFPLYQAAELAGNFLETAKAYGRNGESKNAFSLWGQPLDWRDFEWAKEWHDRVRAWLTGDGKARRALVFKLARIASMYEQARREHSRRAHLTEEQIRRRVRYERWLWTLVYYLAREDEGLQQELDQLRGELVNGTHIEQLALLARWIELSTR